MRSGTNQRQRDSRVSAIWQGCLRHLEAEFDEKDINTFVRPLQAEELPDLLLLRGPNRILVEQVRNRFLGRIVNYVRAFRDDLAVDLQVQDAMQEEIAEIPAASGQRPTPDFNSLFNFTDQLLPSYTFDRFVEGRSNELAHAAAKKVAQEAGHSDCNPYVIYGGVGLGKTHLMQAIGHEIRATQPETNVVYLHCEQFVQNLIDALRNNRVNAFKSFYRSADVLLIDDIHFLAGKQSSQEEFFHTFNVLSGRQRQIVATCDRYPPDIDKMEKRLTTRLGGGMCFAIEPPSNETRAAILLNKAEQRGIELNPDIAWFIAEKTVGSIRELESALNRVIMQANVSGQAINVDFTRHCLRDIMPVRDRRLNAAQIKAAVAEYFSVNIKDLDSQRRPQAIVVPRQMAMKLLHDLTQMSLASIGEAFGGRDHSTVLYACQKVQRLIDEGNENTITDFRNLKRKLLQ